MGGRRGRAPRIKPEPYEFMSHYPDWTRLLEDGLERCRAEHPGGRDQHVDLVISLTSGSGTHEEIVDVELDGKPTGLGECLVEEAWKLEIPRLDRGERSMFWVTVR